MATTRPLRQAPLWFVVTFWFGVTLLIWAATGGVSARADGSGVGTCSGPELLETIPTQNPDVLHFVVTGATTWAYGLNDADYGDAIMSGLTADFDVETVGETVYVFCEGSDAYTYEWTLDSEAVTRCVDTLDCTDTDIVTGLAQLSTQVHTLSVFLVLVSVVGAVLVGTFSVLAFVWSRHG